MDYFCLTRFVRFWLNAANNVDGSSLDSKKFGDLTTEYRANLWGSFLAVAFFQAQNKTCRQ